MRSLSSASKLPSPVGIAGLFALLVVGTLAHAGEYVPLVSWPGLQSGTTDMASYFNRLYMVAVAIGAILAFIKISIAGVKWSMSDVVTDKSSAREDIKGALLGLAILLIPFIVLNTIYDGLVRLNVLENSGAMRVNTDVPPSSSSYSAPVQYYQPTSVPTYNQTTRSFVCATATDCTAAQSQCNAIPGSSRSSPTSCATGPSYTCINCTYMTNTAPDDGGGNNPSTPG